jgi:hypothetical protein
MSSDSPILARSSRFLALVCTLLLAFAYPAFAAVDATDSLTQAQSSGADAGQDAPPEVTIEAHKAKLYRIRKEMEKSVDAFYEAFDRVNTVPGYETHCADETPPNGSRFTAHICTPQFVHDATDANVRSFFFGNAAIPPATLVALRMRGYKQRVEALMRSDVTMREAARNFDELHQEYEIVRTERVKAR